MSSASERGHFIMHCSCSFSFPWACRKKLKYAGSQKKINLIKILLLVLYAKCYCQFKWRDCE